GRSSQNDVVLQDAKVSRHHARIERRQAGYYLVDLHSSNGSFVNGRRVEHALLHHGDEIRLGNAVMEFRLRS
ncbi:MAG: FHA domain-containing protein, partial [Chloroflexi bacterium]|nr:FHA domain-containing protein [Chloroflexota bacterium]